ncbi:hypothetical protein [Paenalcaligenes hominis]
MMQEQGSDQEQAALTLGATGWQIFYYVTLPKIKWVCCMGWCYVMRALLASLGSLGGLGCDTRANINLGFVS